MNAIITPRCPECWSNWNEPCTGLDGEWLDFLHPARLKFSEDRRRWHEDRAASRHRPLEMWETDPSATFEP